MHAVEEETLGGGWKKTHSLKCRNQKRGRTDLHQVRTFKGMVIFLPRMFTWRTKGRSDVCDQIPSKPFVLISRQ